MYTGLWSLQRNCVSTTLLSVTVTFGETRKPSTVSTDCPGCYGPSALRQEGTGAAPSKGAISLMAVP